MEKVVKRMAKFLILVPARYGSSRFPGKPLAKIHNKMMIEYVIQNCKSSGFDYSIVTDSDEIESGIRGIGGNIVRVDDDVTTGSARIALAYQRFFKNNNYDYIINVQGDEPLLLGETMKRIGEAHANSPFDIYTALKKREWSYSERENPNVVKCVKSDITHQCLYFSRSTIPYDRDGSKPNWFQHVGVYSYKVAALEKFVELDDSGLENIEKLEQLRALENGLTIGAIEIEENLIGVDTPEDIKRVEKVLM